MTGYSADLERLDAGARELKGFAGQATEIAGALDRALASFGACWGDDAVGRSFAAWAGVTRGPPPVSPSSQRQWAVR